MTETPSWLAPTIAIPPPSDAPLQLLHTRYEIVLESVLDRMCSGQTLTSVIRDDFREIDPGAFIRWIRKDKERNRRYEEAKEIRTEAWAGRIIEEAEGVDSTNDVNRSKLIIDTHKWLMSMDNKHYRPAQSVEVNTNISITAALNKALEKPHIEGEWYEEA